MPHRTGRTQYTSPLTAYKGESIGFLIQPQKNKVAPSIRTSSQAINLEPGVLATPSRDPGSRQLAPNVGPPP